MHTHDLATLRQLLADIEQSIHKTHQQILSTELDLLIADMTMSNYVRRGIKF